MTISDVSQFELLARIDRLIERVRTWSDAPSPWEPVREAQALVRRLLGRMETLRIRLESPLIVATFGGTGAGKSTLVNALVGQECSASGRQRPTTTRPILIHHPDVNPAELGLPLQNFESVSVNASLLRDVVLLDCPDPDTSETNAAESNLGRLRELIPFCDVLLYVSTQQKYRSARVLDELGQAAAGCRLVFVQTRADLDEDIRADWKQQLAPRYAVPDMFFVDSLRALTDQQDGRNPRGDFGRLLDLLASQLAVAHRVTIRRANLLDLMHGAVEHCRRELHRKAPLLEEIETALVAERDRLTEAMAKRLSDELGACRSLWEKRLLGAVTQAWGLSPFSAVLRTYHGLGGLLASFTLARARSTAQLAMLGAIQGSRWLDSLRKQQQADSRLDQVDLLGLDENLLRESQLVIAGHVRSANLDPRLISQNSLDRLRAQAAQLEDRFLGAARRKIDNVIEELAKRNSRFFTRAWYELLFASYLGFVLYRVGRNFFYDSLIEKQPLLSTDFYLAAAVFFVIWSGLLLASFLRRLRRGLGREVKALTVSFAHERLSLGLFPELEEACRITRLHLQEWDSLGETISELRQEISQPMQLGAALSPHVPSP